MARILTDTDIKKILGSIIIDGDESCIRPNSYVLRLGSTGEFLNTNMEYELGKAKKGIKLMPGQSVAVTAYETLNFSRKAVHQHFPGHDLHGFLSPTTDLSREGIGTASTQIDAGYNGTLNWTLTNSSSEERRFVLKEKLFRLTIFELMEGESPDQLYEGDYQEQTGYVTSRRAGAPVGMKETEWEDGLSEGGPEEMLDQLIKSGYPWHALGQRLKQVDDQLKTVTNEYSEIHDAINRMTNDVNELRERQKDTSETVRTVLRDEANSLQNRWLIGAGSLIFGAIGIVLAVTASDAAVSFFKDYGTLVGALLVFVAIVVVYMISRRK